MHVSSDLVSQCRCHIVCTILHRINILQVLIAEVYRSCAECTC